MKIAYLINQYPKVSHTFIRREVLALEKIGPDITRFALRGWRETAIDETDKSEQQKTTYVLNQGIVQLGGALLASLVSNPIRFWSALKDAYRLSIKSDRPLFVHAIYLVEASWLATECHKQAIGHLHAHFGTNAAAIALLCRALGGPTFSFTVHGPEEFDKPEALQLNFKASRAKFIAVVSSYGRSQLMRWVAPKDSEKIKIVRCGLENGFFGPDGATESNDEESRTFVCVGRLNEQKGHLTIIEAAAQLKKKGVEFSLILAGGGELQAFLTERIGELGLADRITITGWISQSAVKALIDGARTLVVPSYAEGLPVVIMEAFARNKPVISTYIAGIPELVRHNDNGWLVPASDANSLAEAMENCLLASNDRMLQMGASGYARTKEFHCIDSSAVLLQQNFFATFNRDVNA